jgi:glycerophosphoryl diester phosphodiesterase
MTVKVPFVEGKLLSHRGASAYLPENTLEAVQVAADMGATWIETDVQFTRDNQLVMIHDTTLDRTTNGTGYVAQASLDYIKGLDAGSWIEPRFAGLTVPTLEEFINCIVENGLNLQLELKELTGREKELAVLVCNEIEKSWPFGVSKLFFSGFSERCLRYVGEILPEVPRALAMTCVPADPDNLAKETGINIMHVQDKFTDATALQIIAKSNVEFGVATVNDPDRAKLLLEAGVQQVLTDDPLLLALPETKEKAIGAIA